MSNPFCVMFRMNSTRRFLLLAALLAAGFSGLAWLCHNDPGLGFLPARAPAEWIVYPNPPDSMPHGVADSSAVFRCGFKLESVPSQASLALCAFRGATAVSVNGRAISHGAATPRNWKQPVKLDLAGMLHAGDNQIAITVRNDSGPPALWAVLDCGALAVRSDATWEVSWAGAAWRPARLARNPMPIGLGSPLGGGEKPLHSLRLVWPALALIAAIVAGVLVAFQCSFKLLRLPAPTLALCLFIAMWVGLFANNMRSLPRTAGFDANSHMEYIQFLLTNGRLPLAAQGWEMFQPPLYYVVSATLLAAFGLRLDDTGVLALRQLGLVIAVAQLVLLGRGLRLVFPDDAKKQIAGLTVAAFLPANLLLSQFITNESLAAVLVTASLLLCLLVVRNPAPGWRMFLSLGACLGAAMLAKSTAALAVLIVFGSLLACTWKQPPGRRGRWLLQVAAAGGLCVLAGGSHYARLWANYGSPVLDQEPGLHYWQDDGFRTASYYLRFGAALSYPWFAGFASLADGIYSTLWGDGLLSGVAGMNFRLPWNYGLMAAGFLLALVPTLLSLTGVFAAAARFIRAPRAELVILPAYAAASLLALGWMSFKVPSYGVKAFYLLSAILPLSVLAGLGWDILTRHSRLAAGVVGIALGSWALTSYCSFWIPASSSSAEEARGTDLWEQQRFEEAIDCYSRAIEADRSNLSARSLLVHCLAASGRRDDSLKASTLTVQEFPEDGAAHLDRAFALAGENQWDEALAEAHRAVALAPDDAAAHAILISLLERAHKTDEAVQACREALRVSPLDANLHERLGLALAAQAPSGSSSAATPAQEASDQRGSRNEDAR
jgi:tetratricopeptide (TPR) repeat protein